MLLLRNVDVVSLQYSLFQQSVRGFFNILTPFVIMYFCWHGLHAFPLFQLNFKPSCPSNHQLLPAYYLKDDRVELKRGKRVKAPALNH